MTIEPGTPTWVDLGTTDLDAAKTFYHDIFGWNFTSMGEEFGNYQIVDVGVPVGGAALNMNEQGELAPSMPAAFTVYLRTDDIAATIVHTVMSKIKEIPMYRDAIPTQSVLTITSNVVYGKATGSFPSGHQKGTPFSPGANPENGADSHGMVASMLSVGKLDYNDALDGISLTNTITPQGLGRDKEEQVKNLVGILDAGFVMDDDCSLTN